MSRYIRLILFSLTFAITNQSVAEGDSRVMVDLPAPMKAHMLQNMRAHLEVIDQLILLVSEDRVDEAAELAESELGMSSLQKHGASHIAQFYPEGMRQAGFAMHQSASRFSTVVQEGDTIATLKALRQVTAACTGCHAVFRVN